MKLLIKLESKEKRQKKLLLKFKDLKMNVILQKKQRKKDLNM